MDDASYRERAGAPIRNKSFWWTAVKALRWFLGLDEADRFAIPIRPTDSGVDS